MSIAVISVRTDWTVSVDALDQAGDLLPYVRWEIVYLALTQVLTKHLQAHRTSSALKASHQEVMVAVLTLHFASLY